MATLEERVAALEHARETSDDAISDLNHHVTILVGVISKQGQDIREIKHSLRTIDNRIGLIETKLDEHTGLLAQILARLPEKP